MAIGDDLAGALFPTLQEMIEFFSQKLGQDALNVHDFEATGALLRALARKHGSSALQAIEEYFGERGKRNAALIKAELPDTSLESLKNFFLGLASTGEIQFTDVQSTEDRFFFSVENCPIGYTERMIDQKVCDCMMAIDRKMVETVSEGKLTFETIKGPPNCRNVVRKVQ